MRATQFGCYYCFKTLDPKDKQDKLRTFVQCQQCGILYHEQCWHTAGHCPRCESDEAHPKNITSPAPVRTVTKTHALPITPSAIVYIDAEGQSYNIPAWQQNAQNMERSLRSAIVALLLIGISVLIGIFVYRITQLDLISPGTVMDTIFKSDLPDVFTIIGACIAGLITALVFYPKHSRGDHVPLLTRFLAGVIGFFLIDALLVSIAVKSSGKINSPLYLETIWAQGSTSLMVLTFAPIYKWKAPEAIPPRGFISPVLMNVYGWCRLLAISVAIVFIIAYLSASDEVMMLLETYVPRDISLLHIFDAKAISNPPDRLPFGLSFPTAGALLAGLAVASIVYWVPKHRQLQGNFILFRVILAVSCIIFVGLLYRTLPEPSSYLNTIIVAGLTALIATPLQYALS